VQDLMRHSVPNGDPSEIFDRALTMLLERLQRTKLAATERPRVRETSTSRSRHIPAAVKREVWARDGGRCAFVGKHGRCTETGFLELHHLEPYAAGGEATVENIQIRCKRHNMHEAELFFGAREPPMVRESRPVFWT
jgi:5-methylcytosine-specific restriction endonuclease McrA